MSLPALLQCEKDMNRWFWNSGWCVFGDRVPFNTTHDFLFEIIESSSTSQKVHLFLVTKLDTVPVQSPSKIPRLVTSNMNASKKQQQQIHPIKTQIATIRATSTTLIIASSSPTEPLTVEQLTALSGLESHCTAIKARLQTEAKQEQELVEKIQKQMQSWRPWGLIAPDGFRLKTWKVEIKSEQRGTDCDGDLIYRTVIVGTHLESEQMVKIDTCLSGLLWHKDFQGRAHYQLVSDFLDEFFEPTSFAALKTICKRNVDGVKIQVELRF